MTARLLPQRLGWPVIARGESALILAPTGTGKTLTAFLWCLDRLMLHDVSEQKKGCRIVYISPLKALAVDVERNLRSPLAGISNMARRKGVPFHDPSISVRTGDTPQSERARFRRDPAEILITTPESLYLLLTSQSADALRTVDTVIIDEIHALVPTKRGAHLALSLERLESLTGRWLQRIGLSATQRPLEEVARFLGGVEVVSDSSLLAKDLSSDQQGRTLNIGSQSVVANDNDARELADGVETFPSSSADSPGKSEQGGVDHSRSESGNETALRFRPVTIINASAPKQLKLRIEVPVEDMARLQTMEEIPSGAASQTPEACVDLECDSSAVARADSRAKFDDTFRQ